MDTDKGETRKTPTRTFFNRSLSRRIRNAGEGGGERKDKDVALRCPQPSISERFPVEFAKCLVG
jgi:hypothetical protein